MALPTLAKTWQFNVNQQVLAQGTAQATNQRLLRLIKNSLVGFGTNPWQVRYSCDSIVAGAAGDLVDRWAADANLVGGAPGAAHSWIVLRQTGIATNFELLISIESGTTVNALVLAFSPSAGFSGGTTTARPTATDEILMLNNGTWNANTNANHQIHAMQSSDGQVTRVMLWEASVNCTFWAFEKPNNPRASWTNPSCVTVLASSSSTVAAFGNLSPNLTAGGGQGSSKGKGVSGASFAMAWTGETAGSSGILANAILNTQSDFDASWDFFPIGIASTTTLNRGRMGSLFDIWWGSTGTSSADTYPNDASKQFAQLGNIILPWNGTTPLIV